MKKKPTKAQKVAADAVRNYLNEKGLQIDEEVRDDGNIVFDTSGRDENDIADEEPCQEIRQQFANYVQEMRDLSNLIYIGREYVDEWVNLTITVRSKPRKPRPAEMPKLAAKVLERMPRDIAMNQVVTHIGPRYYRSGIDGVEVATNRVATKYNRKLTADLKWDLRGNSIDGWDLVVNWGCHKASRPATFKKLTPKIILAQLARITAQLKDPLDCLGHMINVRNDHGFVMDRVGRYSYAYYEILEGDEKTVRAPHGRGSGHVVVFTNRLTDEITELNPGDELPTKLKPLELN